MSPRLQMSRTGRAPAMLVALSLVLAAPLLFAGPAHAEDIRPVNEATEEQIAEEAALENGVVTEPSSVDGPDPVDAVVFGCGDQGTHYRVFNKKNDIHIPAGIDFKSGPGGSTKASVQHSLSTSLKVSMGAKFSAGALVASAETTFGIEASVTATIQQAFEYSHPIANNKYGHLRFGNWGWRMGVEKYTVDRNCRVTSSTKGTVTAMPSASSWGYRYWETSS